MSGGEADRKLLEVSSKQQMYGLKFLPTQDSKGNNLKISPNHQGVVVYNVSLFVNTLCDIDRFSKVLSFCLFLFTLVHPYHYS